MTDQFSDRQRQERFRYDENPQTYPVDGMEPIAALFRLPLLVLQNAMTIGTWAGSTILAADPAYFGQYRPDGFSPTTGVYIKKKGLYFSMIKSGANDFIAANMAVVSQPMDLHSVSKPSAANQQFYMVWLGDWTDLRPSTVGDLWG